MRRSGEKLGQNSSRNQLSCLSEIFGGGRGDKNRLSYMISPVFNLSTLGMQ